MKTLDLRSKRLWLRRVRGVGGVAIACAMLLTSPAIMAARSTSNEAWFVPRQARELRNPVPMSQQGLKSSAQIYQKICAVCHGRTGASNGPAAQSLPQSPADFTSEDRMRRATDGELFWKISKGRASMPSCQIALSPTQRWQLVNYLRMLTIRAQYRYLGTAE